MSVTDPSDELRRRMDELNITVPAVIHDSQNAAARSARSRKRALTGAQFEAELNDTHAGMLARGEALILPHYPPTVHVGKRLVYRKGGGPCDYSGHVNLMTGIGRSGARPVPHSAGGKQVPVVFDAKVLSAGHATYVHDHERVAQLFHLRNALDTGAAAFLLVRADTVSRVFLISARRHLDTLLTGGGVTLFEQHRRGSTPVIRLGRTKLVQQFETEFLFPNVPYTLGKGWLWAPLLEGVL
jgi:hypothetical protein